MTAPLPAVLAELRRRGGGYCRVEVRITVSPDPDVKTVKVYVFDPAVKRETTLENWYKRTLQYEVSEVRDDVLRAMLKRYRLIAFEVCEEIVVDAKLELLHEPNEFDTAAIVAVSPDFENPLTGKRTSFRDFRTLHHVTPVIVA